MQRRVARRRVVSQVAYPITHCMRRAAVVGGGFGSVKKSWNPRVAERDQKTTNDSGLAGLPRPSARLQRQIQDVQRHAVVMQVVERERLRKRFRVGNNGSLL